MAHANSGDESFGKMNVAAGDPALDSALSQTTQIHP
jgi:hypothetical protein